MELVRLIGHSAGGRPGERLMERFAMPASDDTILRQLKRAAKERPLPRDNHHEIRIASPENVPERLIVTSPRNTGYIRYAKLAFN